MLTLSYVKEARHRKTTHGRIPFYEMSPIGKSIENECRSGLEVTTKGRGLFKNCNSEDALELVQAMVAQLCQYSKNRFSLEMGELYGM